MESAAVVMISVVTVMAPVTATERNRRNDQAHQQDAQQGNLLDGYGFGNHMASFLFPNSLLTPLSFHIPVHVRKVISSNQVRQRVFKIACLMCLSLLLKLRLIPAQVSLM
jgi:hypothetical protein